MIGSAIKDIYEVLSLASLSDNRGTVGRTSSFGTVIVLLFGSLVSVHNSLAVRVSNSSIVTQIPK